MGRIVHRMLLPAASAILAGCAATPNPLHGGRWIDLTHAFSSETLYWPTSERFSLETVFDGTTDKGYHYSANQFCAAEHGGTHVDAPIHFAAGGAGIDEVGLDHLIGQAIVVDVSERASLDRDYRVGIADFTGWEQRNGRIPAGALVLLRTGYDRYWPDAGRYLGTAERGQAAVAKLHFPGLDAQAAQWLADERRIHAVGLDTASIDYGQSTRFESHRVLASRRIPIFENVSGLAALPPTGAWVIALPMKIKGGSGAPLRLIAWVP